MREILFRGKRTDNGKWVEGLLARYNTKYEIANMATDFDMLVPVYAETIGQYTGLKDSKGNKIFEGDILKTIDLVYPDEPTYTLVKWDNDMLCWAKYYYFKYHKEYILDGELYLNRSKRYDIEVIGNIYDNAELLK